jgi:hypothetical protein
VSLMRRWRLRSRVNRAAPAIYYPAPRKPEPSAPPQPKWQEPPIDGATMKERIVANSE